MVFVKARSYFLFSVQCFAVSFLIGMLAEAFIQNPVIAASDMNSRDVDQSGTLFVASSTPTAVPAGSPVINGKVTYGNAIGSPAPPRSVSNVVISAAGSPNASVATAFPDGTYSLTGISEGAYTVTPAKTGGINGSINSFDAAKVAQHTAGTSFLTANQKAVADVSGNGIISSFDAALVARFAAFGSGGVQTGTWKFVLASKNYPSVSGTYSGEDYTAWLMGDVSGNWTDGPLSPTNTPTNTPTNIPTPTGNNIALYPSTVFQTMRGWEADAQAGQLFSPAWNNYKSPLLDQTVNDLGINRVRLEITSGVENLTDYFTQWQTGQITESQYNAKRYEIVNDDGNPNAVNPNGFKWAAVDSTINQVVIPLRQRLQARGESLWVNVCYVDFGSSTFEHKNTPAEYAEFVLATYEHMQTTFGLVPDSWEIVLEPDTSAASWSATQVANAIKAAGDRLVAAGFTPRFVAPSVTDAGNAINYINQISNTAGAMAYVDEFSYHLYAGNDETNRTNIANLATTNGKKTAMLEFIGADYSTLHADIKTGRNSSWQQFTLAFPNQPDNGGQYYVIDDSNITSPVITMGSRTKFLRQYFKFIRAGAQRIEALTGNASFDPLAFVNTNGKYVVVVKASGSGAFNIQGLPAGLYGIKYTTDNQYDIDLSDVSISGGQTFSAAIPAAGVITIYAK